MDMKKARAMGKQPMQKGQMKLLGRVLKYVLKHYTFSFIVVVICILIQAVSTIYGMTFMQALVDDYIAPLIGQGSPDFSPLAGALLQLGIIYAIGLVAAYAYNRIMVNVGQGTLRYLRDDLFSNMETLPIKYFDTHPHGDIMSVYTNDVDTLRQFICQSIPQVINSSVTLVLAFVSMITMNIPMTILTVVMAVISIIGAAAAAKLLYEIFSSRLRKYYLVDGD